MIAASLIDENRFSYTLNSLSWIYLNKGKNESLLNKAAKERGLDPKADMWKMPASEVGAYAEEDAALTLELWNTKDFGLPLITTTTAPYKSMRLVVKELLLWTYRHFENLK
jgi:hypothetical protein